MDETQIEMKSENDCIETQSDSKKDNTKFLNTIQSLIRLAKFGGRKSWIMIFGAVICAGINGVAPVAFFLILGDIIDTVNLPPEEMRDEIFQSALQMLYISIGSGILSLIQGLLIVPGRQYLKSNLRKAFMKALVQQELGYFDANKTGGMMNSISEQTNSFAEGFGERFTQFSEFLIQGIVGFTLSFVYSWEMALVVMAVSPGITIVGLTIHLVSTKVERKTAQSVEDASNVAEEVISSFKTVRSFSAEEKEVERYSHYTEIADKWFVFKGLFQGLSMGSNNFLEWGTCALAFWYGGRLVYEGDLTMGEMFKVFGMILFAAIGFAQAMNNFQSLSNSFNLAPKLLKFFDRTPLIPFSGGRKLDNIRGDISLRDVTFSYPTRSGLILKGITLDIHAGETVALVGSSGSGKSTIFALIERFYELDRGTITIDGNNILELDPRWLHRKIGIVTQEPILFATTIEENIKYGVDHATLDDVISVAKAANAHQFISGLEDQYQTVLGERGVSLSGGQKQRIAIARALLKNPHLLLLDEATSALDTESEHLVQEALDRMMVDRTALVIAHRLSTVKDADRILVIEKGELVEMGAHEELLKIENGHYSKLAERQMAFSSQ